MEEYENDLKRIKEYLNILDEIEADNEWLPSPHEIEPFIDDIELIIFRLGDDSTIEMYDISDRLSEHYRNAYEQ